MLSRRDGTSSSTCYLDHPYVKIVSLHVQVTLIG